MPEIFDQIHDWIGVLLSKEPKQSHLFTLLCSTIFWITFALVKRRAGTLIEPYDITAGQ